MPTITKPNLYFDVVTYTGTGATQTISGLNFQPDFVWIKSRSAATDNKLTDAVRGATKGLISNTTGAETTDTNGITAFTSSGFTLGSDSVYNNSGATYVAWCWKANGSGSTNTAGSITSTVSANTTSGFSVVTWTGNNAASATIGHGLGTTPVMIIAKERNFAGNWFVYTATTGNTKYLSLNTTAAEITYTPMWNSTSPTSTVFTTAYLQATGINYVAYCFAPIAGYSAFGTYTGNGSADGPFVYCGFRPAFVLIKNSTSTSGPSWQVRDSARIGYNSANYTLYPNLSNAEYSTSGNYEIDFLSNGFKIRTATDAGCNGSGDTMIFAAFASAPLKYSLAR